MNGVSQHILKILNPYTKFNGNLVDLLNINEKTSVTFIGLMKPLIREISKASQLITIVEDSLIISPELRKFKFGHDINQLLNAFEKTKQVKGKPAAIIAHTVKGKGVSFMENNVHFHGVAPNAQELEIALKELA